MSPVFTKIAHAPFTGFMGFTLSPPGSRPPPYRGRGRRDPRGGELTNFFGIVGEPLAHNRCPHRAEADDG